MPDTDPDSGVSKMAHELLNVPLPLPADLQQDSVPGTAMLEKGQQDSAPQELLEALEAQFKIIDLKAQAVVLSKLQAIHMRQAGAAGSSVQETIAAAVKANQANVKANQENVEKMDAGIKANQEKLCTAVQMVTALCKAAETKKNATKKTKQWKKSRQPPTHRPTDGCVICWEPTNRRCGFCRTVRYCTEECQKAARRNHKKDCQQMGYLASKNVVVFSGSWP